MKKTFISAAALFIVLSFVFSANAQTTPSMLGTYSGNLRMSSQNGFTLVPATITITSAITDRWQGTISMPGYNGPVYGLKTGQQVRCVCRDYAMEGTIDTTLTRLALFFVNTTSQTEIMIGALIKQ